MGSKLLPLAKFDDSYFKELVNVGLKLEDTKELLKKLRGKIVGCWWHDDAVVRRY